MGDVDVLAMLFDGDNGILGLDSSSKRTLGTTTTSVDNSFTGQPFHSKGMDMSLMAGDGGIEDDWPSSLLSGSLVSLFNVQTIPDDNPDANTDGNIIHINKSLWDLVTIAIQINQFT